MVNLQTRKIRVMRRLILILLIVFTSCEVDTGRELEQDKPLKIAFIADVQYCDCDDNGGREYRKSLGKLRETVNEINNAEVDYTIQLGDLIDRNLSSFDSVLPILDNLNNPLIHVLGNHDFEVEHKGIVPRILGLENRHYKKEVKDFTIVVLDGQEISTFAYDDENHPNVIKAKNYLESVDYTEKGWNGAMSEEQVKWLENILKTNEKPIIIVSHYPIFPLGGQHNLWNDEEVYNLIEEYSEKVVGYYNGHAHKEEIVGKYHNLGAMVEKEGINYYTVEL